MSQRLRDDDISRLLDTFDDDDESETRQEILSEPEDNLEVEEHQLTDSEPEENIIGRPDIHESSDSDVPISQLRKRQRRIESSSPDSEDSAPEQIVQPSQDSLQHDPRVIIPRKKIIRGKNGHKWTTKPRQRRTRAASRNILRFTEGPQVHNIVEPSEIFSLFLSDEMLEDIVKYTNEEIELKKHNYAQQTSTIAQTDIRELKALLGLLLVSAAVKSNHLPSKLLFNTSYSASRFKACMSVDRFEFLINSLRFDDKSTRSARRTDDKFAAFRDLWETFINNCKKSYTPGAYVTIDEQLVGFRGRCPFRIYMPNKPNKYGIKIVMVADVKTKYVFNATPYLGKENTPRNEPLADYYVKSLTSPLHGSNRNITMDNWFTSVPLAAELLKAPYNLMLVGTLRSNKREIPNEIKDSSSRRIGTSVYCFDEQKTLVSYKPKKNKIVYLLSTTHDDIAISTTSGKPEIIEFYNSTKGAVDTVDQMCSAMCCNRKTRRWPLCLFYNLINITIINSYVIYVSNNCRNNKNSKSRRDFVLEMADALMEPHLKERINIPTLRREIKKLIETILHVEPVPEAATIEEPNTRKICAFCPSKSRKMTTHFCMKCKRAICRAHNMNMCPNCVE